jgi:hypothetical protein
MHRGLGWEFAMKHAAIAGELAFSLAACPYSGPVSFCT